jgi:hypothetical protein
VGEHRHDPIAWPQPGHRRADLYHRSGNLHARHEGGSEFLLIAARHHQPVGKIQTRRRHFDADPILGEGRRRKFRQFKPSMLLQGPADHRPHGRSPILPAPLFGLYNVPRAIPTIEGWQNQQDRRDSGSASPFSCILPRGTAIASPIMTEIAASSPQTPDHRTDLVGLSRDALVAEMVAFGE